MEQVAGVFGKEQVTEKEKRAETIFVLALSLRKRKKEKGWPKKSIKIYIR